MEDFQNNAKLILIDSEMTSSDQFSTWFVWSSEVTESIFAHKFKLSRITKVYAKLIPRIMLD